MLYKPVDQRQIAIVGAGFGGCSTAYFLRRLFGNTLGIRIFECSDHIGGRVRAIKYNNGEELYESGAAIFTSNHKYMLMLAKEFRLKVLQLPPPDGALCLHNGYLATPAWFTKDGPLRFNRFLFAMKYFSDFLRFKCSVIRHVKEFDLIYERQKNREAFTSPIRLVKSLSPNFESMLSKSFGNFLDANLKLSKKFCNDVVYGFVANCFCSDLTVHAFAGMTASSGFGASLYSIVGGNEQIAQNLASRALNSNPPGIPREVSLNTTVTKIFKGSQRRYRLIYEETDSGTQKSEEFDYVVLAFPLHEDSGIKADPEIAQVLPKPKPYRKVDFIHFHGDLSPVVFPLPADKLKDTDHTGVTILPTEDGYMSNGGTYFKYLGRAWSVAPKQESDKPLGCFSAFSVPDRTSNPDVEIPRRYALPGWKLVDYTRWYAYPHFAWQRKENLESGFSKFVLADGLIYVNAIEELASNMEFALIGGYNAALLIAQDQIPH
nr:prenylcysteine oxidase [Hymenolepis microstoma]